MEFFHILLIMTISHILLIMDYLSHLSNGLSFTFSQLWTISRILLIKDYCISHILLIIDYLSHPLNNGLSFTFSQELWTISHILLIMNYLSHSLNNGHLSHLLNNSLSLRIKWAYSRLSVRMVSQYIKGTYRRTRLDRPESGMVR